jgi:hypothetical protein
MTVRRALAQFFFPVETRVKDLKAVVAEAAEDGIGTREEAEKVGRAFKAVVSCYVGSYFPEAHEVSDSLFRGALERPAGIPTSSKQSIEPVGVTLRTDLFDTVQMAVLREAAGSIDPHLVTERIVRPLVATFHAFRNEENSFPIERDVVKEFADDIRKELRAGHLSKPYLASLLETLSGGPLLDEYCDDGLGLYADLGSKYWQMRTPWKKAFTQDAWAEMDQLMNDLRADL